MKKIIISIIIGLALVSCKIEREKTTNYPCYIQKGEKILNEKLCYYKGWEVFGKYYSRYSGSNKFILILKNKKTSQTVHFSIESNEWELYKVNDTI